MSQIQNIKLLTLFCHMICSYRNLKISDFYSSMSLRASFSLLKIYHQIPDKQKKENISEYFHVDFFHLLSFLSINKSSYINNFLFFLPDFNLNSFEQSYGVIDHFNNIRSIVNFFIKESNNKIINKDVNLEDLSVVGIEKFIKNLINENNSQDSQFLYFNNAVISIENEAISYFNKFGLPITESKCFENSYNVDTFLLKKEFTFFSDFIYFDEFFHNIFNFFDLNDVVNVFKNFEKFKDIDGRIDINSLHEIYQLNLKV